MRTRQAILRAAVHGPAVLASLLLAAVLVAAVPAALELAAGLALIVIATMLTWRGLERVAIAVVWWARPANDTEVAILAAARAELGAAGVVVGGVYLRRRRGPLVEAVGHHGAVVVDPDLLRAVHTEAVSTSAVAALLAHSVGYRRIATPRCDIALRLVTIPWRVLGRGGARIARAGARRPVVTLAWRLRWLVGVGCLVVSPAGQAPAAWLGAAVVAWSYLRPAARGGLARHAERAGDQLVITAGLGPALADLLRRRSGCPSAERLQRLEAPGTPTTQRHLQLVRD